jgi:hypothetical protein
MKHGIAGLPLLADLETPPFLGGQLPFCTQFL